MELPQEQTSRNAARMSQNDPNVWTGRASQEAFGDGEVGSCANVSGLFVELMLRAMMDIRALPISLADSALSDKPELAGEGCLSEMFRPPADATRLRRQNDSV
jgi:hypothetical protein